MMVCDGMPWYEMCLVHVASLARALLLCPMKRNTGRFWTFLPPAREILAQGFVSDEMLSEPPDDTRDGYR